MGLLIEPSVRIAVERLVLFPWVVPFLWELSSHAAC